MWKFIEMRNAGTCKCLTLLTIKGSESDWRTISLSSVLFTSQTPKKVNYALYTSANITTRNKYIGNQMQNNFGI